MNEVALTHIYRISDNVVAREIEGDFIVAVVAVDDVDMEGELFTLNETARAVWDKLDGVRTLAVVIEELSTEFSAEGGEIESGVLTLVDELARLQMLVTV
jgi:hypothetical protein